MPTAAQSSDSRRVLLFAGIGAAAYFATLLATVPAAFVVPRGPAVAALGGTAWRGEATLLGGDRLSWRWAPLSTLANFAFAADIAVDGAGTALAGRALVRSGSLRLDAVSGAADARLLAVLAPDMGFTCAAPMQLDIARLELGGGDQRIEGRALSESGTCRSGSGAAMPVPPLAFVAEHVGRQSVATLAPAVQRRNTLAGLTLTEDGHLTWEVTRAGAAVLPFAAPAGGLKVETDL